MTELVLTIKIIIPLPEPPMPPTPVWNEEKPMQRTGYLCQPISAYYLSFPWRTSSTSA